MNSIGDASATWYRIGHDTQHASAPDGRTGTGGKKYYGTEVRNPYGDGWRTLDWRMNWRGLAGHDISAGYHYDQYVLNSQTFFSNAAATGESWKTADGTGPMAASRGKTETQALYAQDAWRFALTGC